MFFLGCLFISLTTVLAGNSSAASFTSDAYEIALAASNNNDYSSALKIWRPLALKGEARAQYNVALMYSEGRGVPQSLIQGYLWAALATAQGYADSEEVRDEIAKALSPGDLLKAQSLVQDWKPNGTLSTIDATAVNILAMTADSELLRRLVDLGADATVKDGSGWSPLANAVAAGNTDTAELLLSARARTYDENFDASPIVLAATTSNIKMMHLIMSAGFFREERPLFYRNLNRALTIAATMGNTEMVKEMVSTYLSWTKEGANSRLVAARKKELGYMPGRPNMGPELWDISFVVYALANCPPNYDRGNCLAIR